MNKRRLIAGALSTALLVSALPGLALAQDEGPYPPEGIQWTLSTMNDAAVPEGVEVSLFLSGGEVVGNAGCNSYFGGYEIDETSLTFPTPFGATQMFCEGPAQETEDTYLSLLPTTAGWSVTDEMLLLTDAAGSVILMYGQPPVEITATDIDALNATLADLQTQIDEATDEVNALVEKAEAINVNKFDKRLTQVEKDVKSVDERTKGINGESLKKRVKAVEEAVAALDTEVANLKSRVKALEKNDEKQDERLDAIEAAYPVPEPY